MPLGDQPWQSAPAPAVARSQQDPLSACSESSDAAGPRPDSGGSPHQITTVRRCARISGSPQTTGRCGFGCKARPMQDSADLPEARQARPCLRRNRPARPRVGIPVSLRQGGPFGRGSYACQLVLDARLRSGARRRVRSGADFRHRLPDRQTQPYAQQEDAGCQHPADPGSPGRYWSLRRFCLPVGGSPHISIVPHPLVPGATP